MSRPFFTLTVVTSADGYIARAADHTPQAWASPEEQDLFFRDVAAADWAIMGRHTHQMADRPDRRRIIFSRTGSGWRRPTQVWVDPKDQSPKTLADLVRPVQALKNGIILGGTGVHDWFLKHRAIDRVHLTIEPVRFGEGLPLFSDARGLPPEPALRRAAFQCFESRNLNAAGTLFQIWQPESA